MRTSNKTSGDLFGHSEYDLNSLRQHIKSNDAPSVLKHIMGVMSVDGKDVHHLAETLRLRIAFDQGGFAAGFSPLIDAGMRFASIKSHYYSVHNTLYSNLSRQDLEIMLSLCKAVNHREVTAPHAEEDSKNATTTDQAFSFDYEE